VGYQATSRNFAWRSQLTAGAVTTVEHSWGK
jgi:hypothetical protein